MTTQEKAMPEWRQELIRLAQIDINAQRNEYLFPAPKFLGDWLGVEERDNALWFNVFDCVVLILINLSLLPWLMDKPWYLIAVLSGLRIALLGVPKFILALHYSAHRPIIRPVWLNNLLIEYLITPFFGLPPGVYRFHHIIMHHKEDNIYPYDLSSTMPYQRDNFPFCWLHYWLRFEVAVWFELPFYLFRRQYWGMLTQSVAVIVCWYGGNWYLYTHVRPAISLWLFLMPQLILSMALMWGNFCQHLFVDPQHFEDDHRLTVNLLATPFNQVAFNDGYHIIHHKYPALHWSEMPKRFITQRELDLHVEHDAVCVKDIDW
eukprot:CAMPEP_0202713528 /NCGR_PEP_ID=MMETSP1385-20130828/55587_1 /ASSEMBLY_ACC=CAM_ASM_000861 /TAXON_ID=933848 /ORGANISM="Elphidium margaritaceum" /LENGTH=318 /DNA_ID=CAMNT_0049373907 /DNA_START=18 /DNA_END=971 /DNA_ORIENTATION=+